MTQKVNTPPIEPLEPRRLLATIWVGGEPGAGQGEGRSLAEAVALAAEMPGADVVRFGLAADGSPIDAVAGSVVYDGVDPLTIDGRVSGAQDARRVTWRGEADTTSFETAPDLPATAGVVLRDLIFTGEPADDGRPVAQRAVRTEVASVRLERVDLVGFDTTGQAAAYLHRFDGDSDFVVTLDTVNVSNVTARGRAWAPVFVHAQWAATLDLDVVDSRFVGNTYDRDGVSTSFFVASGLFVSSSQDDVAIDVRASTFADGVTDRLGAVSINHSRGAAASGVVDVRVEQSTFSGNRTTTGSNNFVLFHSTQGNADVEDWRVDVSVEHATFVEAATQGQRPLRVFAPDVAATAGVSRSAVQGTSTPIVFGLDNAGGGNLQAVDLGLAPLADNGGPTPTHRPLNGSPLIDAAASSSATVDQRGRARPRGLAADVGAVEVQRLFRTRFFERVARDLFRPTGGMLD